MSYVEGERLIEEEIIEGELASVFVLVRAQVAPDLSGIGPVEATKVKLSMAHGCEVYHLSAREARWLHGALGKALEVIES